MEDKELNQKIKEDIKALKEKISNEGIQTGNNLEHLYKLVDIEKDLCEIEKEGNKMNYNEYGRYGREQYGNEGYGRRGRYRGHDDIDRMYNEYGRYEEGKEQYNRGNYSAKEDSMKSLKYMLESVVDFVKMLKQDATSQEEVNLIREYSRKLSDM